MLKIGVQSTNREAPNRKRVCADQRHWQVRMVSLRFLDALATATKCNIGQWRADVEADGFARCFTP